ncbi:exodeoxyribonuclease VII small subunit [Corynebacterium auriscanis]|uniref:Exodeoxyribonuclease 7 small subunit n=1 Tax=Corynebacterium auriscanis TaxID=99807 RepID=A0A0A2DJU2_9CORY|nr:exodeoxyribonuclease VII small subunit [Corynebacterium auriscanis]KGM18027.1 exodeoxyribonuclease VII small subunit [Corynebacterium auriscanis]WJY73157.1 exodeoxyribonuclease VII small subunit [Corynebacterium auriscanis]
MAQNNNEEQQKFRSLEEMSYEEARDELIEVVKILELGQMSLDESLNYWERGEELAAYCEDYLDGAATRIETALAKRNRAQAEDAGQDRPNGAE